MLGTRYLELGRHVVPSAHRSAVEQVQGGYADVVVVGVEASWVRSTSTATDSSPSPAAGSRMSLDAVVLDPDRSHRSILRDGAIVDRRKNTVPTVYTVMQAMIETIHSKPSHPDTSEASFTTSAITASADTPTAAPRATARAILPPGASSPQPEEAFGVLAVLIPIESTRGNLALMRVG